MLKKEVVKLRKMGLSLKEIANALGCSKSTASIYSRGVKINDKDLYDRKNAEKRKKASRLASKINSQAWEEKRNKAREKAKVEWNELKRDPEFLGFLGIYWGEGNKSTRGRKTVCVGVANNDPGIIRKCKKFFDMYSPNYTTCRVAVYPDQNTDEVVKFWKDVANVDEIVVWEKDGDGRHRCQNNKYGTFYIGFSNFELYHKIMAWIDCWRGDLSWAGITE